MATAACKGSYPKGKLAPALAQTRHLWIVLAEPLLVRRSQQSKPSTGQLEWQGTSILRFSLSVAQRKIPQHVNQI